MEEIREFDVDALEPVEEQELPEFALMIDVPD